MNRYELPMALLADRHARQLDHGLPLILPASPVSTIGGEPVRVLQRVTNDTVVVWMKPLDKSAV